MNIIYLDTLFFINFVCDYLLLLCSAKICGSEIRRLLMMIAACLGGIYACLCTLPTANWLTHPLIKCVCSILLCVITFWNAPHLLTCTCMFLLLSFAAGGLFSAASITFGSMLYLPIDLKTVIASFLLLYGILTFIFKKLPTIQKRTYKQIHVRHGGYIAEFTALQDSGNELCDPITNLPVLICSPCALAPLFPHQNLTTSDAEELYLHLSSCNLTITPKLIPYRTITHSGLLVGFRPDYITIDSVPQNIIIAISPVPFPASESYQAIY